MMKNISNIYNTCELKTITKKIREINKKNGWNVWKLSEFYDNKYKFGTTISLIHSEASEALEWYRQLGKTGYIVNGKIMSENELLGQLLGLIDPQFGDFSSWFKNLSKIESDEHIIKEIKEEMADIIIRVLNWWSMFEDDPMDTILNKLEKNKKRGFRHGNKIL